jgi:hypothetical protein
MNATSMQRIPAVKKVTQLQLANFVQAKNALGLLQDRTDGMEEDIRKDLEAGAEVEPGAYVATVNKNTRRRPEGPTFLVVR